MQLEFLQPHNHQIESIKIENITHMYTNKKQRVFFQRTAQKFMAKKIHFTFFAQAYYVDAVWGFGCPSGGIRNLGEICHKHNIPVTWLVSPKSARCELEMLTEFHEKYGDEIAMMIRFEIPGFHHSKERTMAERISVEDYRKMIRKQKEEIQNYLPFADIKVAGQGIRTANMMEALRLEGFIGMFGHCYCQIGTDSITDFGMPWGSFPMRPNSVHLPALDEQGVIAFEWTMRDLNRSFHTCRPELWSTDPNDVERGGVCTDTNVEYWKNLFMQYERALEYNPNGIWFQFHQEAHEQTWGEVCKPFTEERVIFCTKMMNLFFDWLITRPNVEFMTATQAAELYRQNADKGTIPMYVPYAWTEVSDHLEFWNQIKAQKQYSGSIHKNAHLPDENLYRYLSAVNDNKNPVEPMKNPPWKDSFFYFDGECQLIFDLNRTKPACVFNYLNFEPDPELFDEREEGGGAPGFYIEPCLPDPSIQGTFSASHNRPTVIELINPRDKVLPYGLFLWESQFPEAKGYFDSLKSPISGISFKVIKDQGVFLRMDLKPGKNFFEF